MINLEGTKWILEVDAVTNPSTNTRGTDANYKLIACLVSNGFQLTVAEQSTSNKCDGGYGSSVPGLGTFTFSGDGQAVSLDDTEEADKINFQTIAELALDKEIFFLRWRDEDDTFVREGKVWISSYDETAPNADAYTFTVTFTGIGKPFILPAVVTP